MPTLTGSIHDLCIDNLDERGVVEWTLQTNAPDGFFEGTNLHLDSRQGRVVGGDLVVDSIVSSDTIDGLSYRLLLNYQTREPGGKRDRGTWDSKWFQITADATLADVASIAIPQAVPLESLAAKIDEAAGGVRADTVAAATDAQDSKSAAATSATAAAGSATAAETARTGAETAKTAAETARDAAQAAATTATAPTDTTMAAKINTAGSAVQGALDARTVQQASDETSDLRAVLGETYAAHVAPARVPQLPPRKLLGGNIVPAPGSDGWRALCYVWDWEGWIRPQIDRAQALGLNAVRIILAPAVTLTKLSTNGSPATGAISSTVWHQRLTQLATELSLRGMALYPCLATAQDYRDRNATRDDDANTETTPTDYAAADVTAAITDTAAALAGFSNVIGFDVLQETGTGPTAANMLSLFAAIRAVAPRVPLTTSFFSNTWTNDTLPAAQMLYHQPEGVGSDFGDFHIYDASTATPTAPDWAIVKSGNRPIIIGEFGSSVSAGSAAGTALVNAAALVHNRDGVMGSFLWALADQGTSDVDKWGFWDNTGWTPGENALAPAASPLSSTAGKRAYLTDALAQFTRNERPSKRYTPPELLPEWAQRASAVSFGWFSLGGTPTIAAGPFGLKMTSTATGGPVVGTDKFPITKGHAYRTVVRTMPAGTARTVQVYLALYDASGTFIGQVASESPQASSVNRSSEHDLVFYLDPASYSSVTQAALRVAFYNTIAGEVHYILDGSSTRAIA